MELDNFLIYSKISSKDSDEKYSTKVLAQLELLKDFSEEKAVREYMKATWKLKDDIRNFQIAPNILFSSRRGKKFFNITFVITKNEEKIIKSFNYKKSIEESDCGTNKSANLR